MFADVVKDRVQNDFETLFVRTPDQQRKVLFPAEHFIDGVVVLDVVLVVAARLEHGREVQCVHAQFFQVPEFLRNARKVPARKALGSGDPAPGKVDVRIVFCEIAARKAVDKDLVKTRAAHPVYPLVHIRMVDVRDLKGVVITQVERIGGRESVFRIIIDPVPLFQNEHIDQAHVGEGQAHRIIVIKAVGIGKGHRHGTALLRKIVLPAIQNTDGRRILFCRAQAQGNPIF